jgi:hypothetical protein
MKQLGRAIMIGAMAIGVAWRASADSIGSKIGEVAEYLITSAVTDISGSTEALECAIAWNETILSTNIQMGAVRTVTYQAEGSNGYDIVRVAFSANGQKVETKQTIGIWAVVLSNQQTQGKDNLALASLMTTLAHNYIEGFSDRSFVYEGTYAGGKVFRLVVEPGHERSNWLDCVWAIVDGTKVVFSCAKEQEMSPRNGMNELPHANKSWFKSAERGTKRIDQ